MEGTGSTDNKTCRWTGQLAWNRAFQFWSILESYILSYQTWFKSIKGFAKNDTVKFNTKNSKSVTLTLRSCTGMGMVMCKIFRQGSIVTPQMNKILEGFEKKKTPWNCKKIIIKPLYKHFKYVFFCFFFLVWVLRIISLIFSRVNH